MFGMKADEVVRRRAMGLDTTDVIASSPKLAGVIEAGFLEDRKGIDISADADRAFARAVAQCG